MARLDIFRQENRILDAVLYYQSEKISHQTKQLYTGQRDMKGALLDLQYYQALLAANKKNINTQEKATQKFVQYSITVLRFKTKPGILNFLLLSLAWIFRDRGNIQQQELLILRAQKEVSIQHSLTQMHQDLQQTGFTQNINPYLQKMMEQGVDRFHYRYIDIRHPDTEYILYFSKSKGSDIYQFDRFEAAALPSWQQLSKHSRQYYSFKDVPGMQINAMEAAHLVNGRAVALEGTKDQWIQIDKTNTTHPYRVVHFDLESALRNTPLPAVNNVEYSQLVEALRAGEKKELTYVQGETTINYTLQASPFQQAIYITDKNGQLIDHKALEKSTRPANAEQFMQQSVSLNHNYSSRLSKV